MQSDMWIEEGLNPFTTGNPFFGTKLLGFSMGRGSGALKGLIRSDTKLRFLALLKKSKNSISSSQLFDT